MSKLSTKDVKTGGGLPKTIEPGELVLKINSIELESLPFMEADNGYFLILHVETKPIDGFEGFFIDKDDESLGRYDGQIGKIKTNRYYYKDGETKSGIKISRDLEILKQIKNICLSADLMPWFDKADNKYDTIEEFVEAFNKDKPFKDLFLKFCLAGKEFERANGYIGFDLFFPKLKRGKIALEQIDAKPSKLFPFTEDLITRLAPKEVDEFDDNADIAPKEDVSQGPPPDFEL